MLRILFLTIALSCGAAACGEPDFIGTCKDECKCTGDSFACTKPKSGGCDNAYRRAWTIAKQDGCQSEYEAYFECLSSKATCRQVDGYPEWGVPDDSCDDVKATYDAC